MAIINTFGFAQKNDSALFVFRQAEYELQQLLHTTFYSRKERERFDGNKQFLQAWEKIISNPKILDYPFEGLLKDVSILSPKDKKFKLITWNIPKDDGTHVFFGFLLVNNRKEVKSGWFKKNIIESYDYFKLIDRSLTIKSPETYLGTPDKWFGMLYTQLIECDGYYTLVGVDWNDKITRRKFVDVLSFRGNGDPVFGKDVFKFPRKNPKRLMFEYSSEVSMSLKYDAKRNQIVYSHLGSKQEGNLLEGQFQYYGPDGSFDALEQKKDKWVTVEDIDARNEKSKNDNAKKPDTRKHKKKLPDYKSK